MLFLRRKQADVRLAIFLAGPGWTKRKDRSLQYDLAADGYLLPYFWRANFDRRHGRPAAALRPRLLLSRTSTRGSAEGGERRRSSR